MADTTHSISRRRYRRPCPKCTQVRWSDQFPTVVKRTGRQGPAVYCQECSVAVGRHATDDHRWRKYGLTRASYEAMYAAQGGCCSICRDVIGLDDDPDAHIDHDHGTGAVRGVVCRGCNLGLGFFRDDPARLEAAIAYLAASKAVRHG